MTELTGDKLAAACAEAMYARDTAAQKMNITLNEVREGFAELKMTVGPHMLNGHDICHGGYIFSLADTAFAYACNSRNITTVAQNCDIEFVKTSHEGDVLTAVAEERHRTGRTGMYEVNVTRPDGEIVARFRGHSYQLKGKIIKD